MITYTGDYVDKLDEYLIKEFVIYYEDKNETEVSTILKYIQNQEYTNISI